jgi:hypothetical protein
MLAHARARHHANPACTFVGTLDDLPPATYTLASGIFNVRLDTPADEWQTYLLQTLDHMAARSQRGFAFNVLTGYADPEYMRPDLYYADPLHLFDYCKRHFSRQVALLHDYPLYEFTILVRL